MNLLDELLADHRPYHDEYQLDNFIIRRSGLTPWGCYRQALRELAKRARGLQVLYAEQDSLLMESRKANATYIPDPHIVDTEREFIWFFREAVARRNQALQGRQLDSRLRADLDREFWLANIQHAIKLDLLAYGGISRSTWDMVLSQPIADRTASIRFVESYSAMLKDRPEDVASCMATSPEPVEHGTEVIDTRRILGCSVSPSSSRPSLPTLKTGFDTSTEMSSLSDLRPANPAHVEWEHAADSAAAGSP